jgi:hypothetical protein
MMLQLMEEKRCQNVLNAELKFAIPKSNGRWPDAQTAKAKECN